MPNNNYFDRSATNWDKEPRRIELMKAVGEAILRKARPTCEMNVLDYGCGTGLLGLFLLPHVKCVVGADSSPGMLDVLRNKIKASGLSNMHAIQLDLEKHPIPKERFHLIVSSMVMHHVADVERVLEGFHNMLLPGGILCIADLDSEPGVFHSAEAAVRVYHNGFDRPAFQQQMQVAGFIDIAISTALVVQKPVDGGMLRDFSIFLMVGRRSGSCL